MYRGKYEILRVVSQPRTLSADIPARRKGVFLFYNPPIKFHIAIELRVNIFFTFLYFPEQHLLINATIAQLNKMSLVSFRVD